MKNVRMFVLAVFAAVTLLSFQATALSQTPNSLANLTGGGGSIRWDVQAANSGVELTIVVPDGRSLHRNFKQGALPEFTLSDKRFEGLPDGMYTYELRLRPVITPAMKEAAEKARGNDDDSEAERAWRKRPALPALVQAGSFAIVNGSIIIPGGVEGQRAAAKASSRTQAPAMGLGNMLARFRNHRMLASPDQVIADDLIVQGSACVGLDCVSGEVFGFDTVRLKENNTRLQFDDTSTSAGFPTNNWQIRANDSGSGGGSFLGIVDQGSTGNSETGTIVGRFDAGAPANSLRVSSTGNVGLGTGTPVLDLHITTSDTPAHRLEQTNAGGFTAQTWDIAGNEANFFVRDVTGGSRLPFRIRPGAPTSSIDIAADGDVGIGTASPSDKLTVTTSDSLKNPLTLINTAATGFTQVVLQGTGRTWGVNVGNASNVSVPNKFSIFDAGSASFRFVIDTSGQVGIGTTAPTQLLSVNGTAGKPGGGTWDVFSDERLKNVKGRYHTGLKALMQLQPIRYEYKADNPLGIKSEGENIGFGAQSLQKIIPEAVTRNSAGYLMVKSDPILWTMLNAIKEQQKQIADLQAEVQKLRAASHRRRR